MIGYAGCGDGFCGYSEASAVVGAILGELVGLAVGVTDGVPVGTRVGRRMGLPSAYASWVSVFLGMYLYRALRGCSYGSRGFLEDRWWT